MEWSNAAYGGRAVEGINITLVNGSMDPWHSLGVINSTSPFYNSCTDHCTQQVGVCAVWCRQQPAGQTRLCPAGEASIGSGAGFFIGLANVPFHARPSRVIPRVTTFLIAVFQELSSTEDVVFMEGTSHCRDMYGSNSDKDPESVKWAHKKIRAAVGRYLGVSSAAGWEKASIELPVA